MTGRTLSNLATLRGPAPQRLVPEHAVGDPQDAIDLGQRRRLTRELHHPVIRLRVLLDLVRELLATPRIEGVPRAAPTEHDLAHAADDLLLALLFRVGLDQDQGFVGLQVRRLLEGTPKRPRAAAAV